MRCNKDIEAMKVKSRSAAADLCPVTRLYIYLIKEMRWDADGESSLDLCPLSKKHICWFVDLYLYEIKIFWYCILLFIFNCNYTVCNRSAHPVTWLLSKLQHKADWLYHFLCQVVIFQQHMLSYNITVVQMHSKSQLCLYYSFFFF